MKLTVNLNQLGDLSSTHESQHLVNVTNSRSFSTGRVLTSLRDTGPQVNKKLNWATIKEQILPFRQIPDISTIQVKTTDQDPLFEIFGIKKSRSKAKLDIIPWNNKKYNRYLVFRLKYMQGLKNEAYWSQVRQLSHTSNVLWMTTLRSIMPDWHRQYPLWYVKRSLKRAREIAKSELVPMASARIYIPKPDGKSRPLGVPEMSWRLYLNLINNFLVMRLKSKINVNQHGFVPGRGTMTAWTQILEEVVNAKDIYEIDLKNAFNSITTKHITRTLVKHGLPKWLVTQLVMCSISPTIFTTDEKVNEEQNTLSLKGGEKIQTMGNIGDNENIKEFDIHNQMWARFWKLTIGLAEEYGIPRIKLMKFIVKHCGNFWIKNKTYYKRNEEKLLEYLPEMETQYIDEPVEFDEETNEVIETRKIEVQVISGSRKTLQGIIKRQTLSAINEYGRKSCGVAQGSPISPFIFALCVDDFFFKKIAKKGIKCIAYADDAIFYGDISNEKDILKESPETGLEINLKKSGWVKRNNTWEGKLKFLGMTYSVEDKQVKWYSSTRSGRELQFDKELLLDMVNLRRLQKKAWQMPETLEEIQEINKKITDLELKIQSRGELIEQLESLGYSDAELIDVGTTSVPEKQLVYTLLGMTRKLKEQEEKEQEKYKEYNKLNGVDLSTKLSTTGLMGFIQSRMYIGSWTYDIKQDFSMSYKEGSWIDIQKKKGLRCNIFNASSFGYGDLLNSLRKKTSNNLPRIYKHKPIKPLLGNWFKELEGPRLQRVKVYRIRRPSK